jgi:hypothetical protein
VDELMWRTAAQLRVDHDRLPCPSCLAGSGCETLLLAHAGMSTAAGEIVLLSDFWRALVAAGRLNAEATPAGWRRFDPQWLTTVFEGELIASTLARRDLGRLFRFLRSRGWATLAISTQTRLATASVSAVRNGRRHITSYDVLVRVCEGLGIARPLMGLGQADHAAHPVRADSGPA